MESHDIAELYVFAAVAEALNFRKAAARLNRSPSAISHALSSLETKLGVRLFNRTTRTVALTDAGSALLAQVQPALASLENSLETVNHFRESPRGTVRINASEIAASLVLEPRLGLLAQMLPELTIEISIDDRFVDIVESGFDAGIRLGEDVGQGMIAVRVSADIDAVIVAAPSYWAKAAEPTTPRDLLQHKCINRRFASGSAIHRWDFARDGKAFSLLLSGPLVLDSDALIRSAAVQGAGVALLAYPTVKDDIDAGRLVPVLQAWCPPISGFHLYYPHARHKSASLKALVDVLRVR